MRSLTEKQIRFCEEYVVDLNASKAAERAGYSVRSAYSIAHELLKKPEILEKISQLKAEISNRTKVDADYVVGHLKEVVERCMQKRPAETYEDEEGNIVVSEYKFDSAGANQALYRLGQHIGMFDSKIQLKTSDDSGATGVIVLPAVKEVKVDEEES